VKEEFKNAAREFKGFWPENYSSLKVLARELNGRIAAVTSRENFDTINYRDRDWDNLIILDACKYETFEKINRFDGDTEKIYSNASHTRNFLKRNFKQDNHDTIYVTANPMSAGYGKYLSKIRHVWKDHWDSEKNTVLPEKVTEEAIKAHREHPDKKIIIHYMQPHFPFIGEKAESMQSQGSFKGSRENPNVWEMLQFDEEDEETVRKAYEENLELVLPEVEKLVGSLDGKTIVTSDHGNLFGKKVGVSPWPVFGHPPNVSDEDLRAVPWLEIDGERRKTTEGEAGDEKSSHQEEKIKEKLADLGYS
jgi:hypothetical protein